MDGNDRIGNLHRAQMNVNFSSPEPRKWTIMNYLAGDNNLESFAIKDLSEMGRGGSSTDVAIVAQLDHMSDQIARHNFINTKHENQEPIFKSMNSTTISA